MTSSRLAPLAAAVLLLAAPLLSACGFTPLYAERGVTPGLASIDVVAPQGRAGELIREHLDDVLARNDALPAAYRMEVQLAEARYPRGLRVDNVATRYEYVMEASYTLTATGAGAGAHAKTGHVRVEVTYDSADQPYASVAAQQDAQDRAAEEAARRIQLELATWFAANAHPKGS